MERYILGSSRYGAWVDVKKQGRYGSDALVILNLEKQLWNTTKNTKD